MDRMLAPPKYAHLEPVNMTLFGKRVFADVIKNIEMRSSWLKVGPNSSDKWP